MVRCRVITAGWVTSGSRQQQANYRLLGTEARKRSGGEMLGHGVLQVGGDLWRSLVLHFA